MCYVDTEDEKVYRRGILEEVCILMMKKYMQNSVPHIYTALCDDINQFIKFHNERILNLTEWRNNYDDREILKSYDLYMSSGS